MTRMHDARHPRRRLWLLLLAAGLVPPAVAEDAARVDPPQGRFDESWMAIMMAGNHIGHAHAESVRQGDHILSSTEVVVRLRRGQAELEIRMTEQYTESIAGQPLGFASESVLAAGPIRQTGTVENGRVKVVSEQFGFENTQEFDYPAGALMPWAAYLEQLKQPVVPGTVIEVAMYVPSLGLNVAVPTRIEIQDRGKLELLGREIEGYRTLTTTTVSNVPVNATGWIDQDWKPLKQTMKMMNFEIEMVRCDKATALRDVTPTEMFITSLIPIDRSLDRDRLRSVTFSMAIQPTGTVPPIPDTDMQETVLRREHEVHILVRRPRHDGLEASAAQHQPGPDLQPYLSSTLFITSDDPAVQAMAREAVGDETNPYRMAERLRRKVSETVRTVNLGTAFATAAEVCRKKEGDCTENGVLLAALGRAVGIPSRVVTGLIYVRGLGGRRDVMGFHMWTQFWIGGRWIDMDAAWGQTVADPTHIALGTHSTADDSIASLVSSVLLQLDELKISVVSVEESE